MAAAGIEIPYFIQGTSLMPIIEEKADSVKEAVFAYGEFHTSEFHLAESMVRSGKFKYVQTEKEEGQLFNLETDPFETTNLIDQDKYSELIKYK